MLSLHREVFVKPCFLNGNIKKHIEERVGDFEGECTNLGYLSKIANVRKIVPVSISNFTGEVKFVVDFDVEVYCPNVGDNFDGTISTIMSAGFFIDNKYMRIFMSYIHLPKGTEIKDSSLTLPSGKTYKEKDDITVEIMSSMFDDGQFKCLGKLIDE